MKLHTKIRAHRSPIWKISTEKLTAIVREAKTFGAVLRVFGIENKGGNPVTLKNRLLHDKIDFEHIATGSGRGGWNKGMKLPEIRTKSLEFCLREMFIQNSSFSPTAIRAYFKRYAICGLYECEICKNFGLWEGQKLVLQLDHRNGNRKDNRPSNLRWLCPNCHSQTETYLYKNVMYQARRNREQLNYTISACG